MDLALLTLLLVLSLDLLPSFVHSLLQFPFGCPPRISPCQNGGFRSDPKSSCRTMSSSSLFLIRREPRNTRHQQPLPAILCMSCSLSFTTGLRRTTDHEPKPSWRRPGRIFHSRSEPRSSSMQLTQSSRTSPARASATITKGPGFPPMSGWSFADGAFVASGQCS